MTVLMPVHNGAVYVRTAIASILGQTFRDFELLIIDDGSTDNTAEIVASFNDQRIRLVCHAKNEGLIATLNNGFEHARGDYIVRMDADDISLPGRISKQVAFLDEHPEVGVCGVWYYEFGHGGGRITRCAPDHDLIRCGSLFNPVVGHSSVAIRKSAFESHSLRYDPSYNHAEDYELWSRALRLFRFANLPEVLLHYRIHDAQVTQSHAQEQMQSAGLVRRRLLEELGIRPDEEEFDIHQMLSALTRPLSFRCQDLPDVVLLEQIDQWLCRLKMANELKGIYPEPEFSRTLVERWVGVLYLNFFLKGKWTSLLMSPELFRKTGLGWGDAGNFVWKRFLWAVSDVRYRWGTKMQAESAWP